MRNLGKCLGAFVVFHAATALASPKALMIGTGDCSEETFLQNMGRLTVLAQKRGDIELIQLPPLFEKRKPLPPQSTQEEQRILETLHAKVLRGDYTAAFRDIQRVLDAAEKMPPSVDAWKLTTKALAMKGFALSRQKKTRASEEAFMAILKLDADHSLDSFLFPPTVIQRFERLRQTLRTRPKTTLTLTSVPEGATVFANGAPLGQTPLKRELLPGHYRIVLEKGGMLSTPSMLSLGLGPPQNMHIPFDWGAAWLKPLCLQEEDKHTALLSRQMASDLGANYLIKVSMLSADSGKKALGAALIELQKGETIREGGISLEGEGDKPEIPLTNLADFIISGKLAQGEPRVLPIGPRGELIRPLAPPSPLPPSEAVALTLPGKPLRGNAARAVSWVFIGTGGALGLGGGLSYVFSLKPASNAKEILQRHEGDEERAQRSEEGARYRAFLEQKKDRQTTAVILGASGVASLVTGLILFWALPPKVEASSHLSVAPHFGEDGGGIALGGRF